MSMHTAPRPHGFTLVEVVIALALTSLLLTGALAALRGFGQTGSRLDALSRSTDDMRLVAGFLHHALENASAREPEAHDARQSWFQGDSEDLAWLGLLPPRHGVGGLTHLRLEHGLHGSRQALMLHMAPFRDDTPEPHWEAFEPRVVLDDVDRVVFSYRAPGAAVWRPNWSGAEGLPGELRIELMVSGQHWPPLFVSPVNALFQARHGG